MTNSEKIRSISDEDLAKKVPCPHKDCRHQNDTVSCVDCCLAWLKEEADENE